MSGSGCPPMAISRRCVADLRHLPLAGDLNRTDEVQE